MQKIILPLLGFALLSVASTSQTVNPSSAPIRGMSSDGKNGVIVAGEITGQNIGGVYQADQFPGVDAGAKIQACLNAVATAGGGTCDARNLKGPITSAASITVGDGTHKVALELPAGTLRMSTGANVFYRSHSIIAGMGYDAKGSAIVCMNSTAAVGCVQSYAESGALYGTYLHDFSIGSTGTPAAGSAALRLAGNGYVDVLSSNFERLNTGGFSYGTDVFGQGGCVCYNKFYDVNNHASMVAFNTRNGSTYNSTFNSNQILSGQNWAPIGLLDVASGMNTYAYLDFEGNKSSNGAILFAAPDRLSAGTGYAVGDKIRPAGGDGTAILTVVKIGTRGSVASVTVTTPGTTYGNNSNQTTTTLTGTGSGAKVDLVVSAYMVLVSGMGPYGYGYGGNIIVSPYEEAGAMDYWCGTGYNLMGTTFGTNGASYSRRWCDGSNSGYGGPQSNFIWGSSATPMSIGIAGTGSYTHPSAYIAFNNGMFDGNLENSGQYWQNGGGNAFTQPVNLFAMGPAYNSQAWSVYGEYGHSPWTVGESVVKSGTVAQGKFTESAITNPAAPALTTNCSASCTGTYTYYLVGHDLNGGVTLPSAAATIKNAPATLTSSQYVTITPPKVDGINNWDVLKGNTSTSLALNARPSTTYPLKDTGQALRTYTPPTRNSTGDLSLSGTATIGTGGRAGKAACWKSDGKTLGYCSTQPDASGSCTCN